MDRFRLLVCALLLCLVKKHKRVSVERQGRMDLSGRMYGDTDVSDCLNSFHYFSLATSSCVVTWNHVGIIGLLVSLIEIITTNRYSCFHMQALF